MCSSEAGVAASAVALSLAAASVRVTATIEVADQNAVGPTVTALSTGILASPNALQTALANAGLNSEKTRDLPSSSLPLLPLSPPLFPFLPLSPPPPLLL